MKYLILLFIPIACSSTLLSQEKVNKTTIYSAEGSVYVGEVIHETVFDIRIVLESQDTITLDKRNVTRMKNIDDNVLMFENGKFHKTSGLFVTARSNVAVINGNGSSSNLSIIGGLRLSEKWQVGIGYGWSFNHVILPGSWWENHDFRNIFGYGRYNILRRKVMIFAETAMGIGLSNESIWEGQYSNGIYMQPGIGIEIANRKKLKFSILISQYLQYTSGALNIGQNFDNSATLNYEQFYNRTMLGVGLTF